MYNFNSINGGFVIINRFTLNKATGLNISFKLFYFSGGIIFFLNTYLKFVK